MYCICVFAWVFPKMNLVFLVSVEFVMCFSIPLALMFILLFSSFSSRFFSNIVLFIQGEFFSSDWII